MTVLPALLRDQLAGQWERVCRLHESDLASGAGGVALPDALDRKVPGASREFAWR